MIFPQMNSTVDLVWLDIDRIHFELKGSSEKLIGKIYGYSQEAIDFFTENSGFAETKYNESKIATYNEFVESGLCGTGYISYPQEIRDITDGKLTVKEVIEGINSRRIVAGEFPKPERLNMADWINGVVNLLGADKSKLDLYPELELHKYVRILKEF